MDVAEHRAVQRHARILGALQIGGSHAQTFAGELDEGFVLGPIMAEQNGEAGHAFAADDTDLDARIVAIGNDRGKPALHKIASSLFRVGDVTGAA